MSRGFFFLNDCFLGAKQKLPAGINHGCNHIAMWPAWGFVSLVDEEVFVVVFIYPLIWQERGLFNWVWWATFYSAEDVVVIRPIRHHPVPTPLLIPPAWYEAIFMHPTSGNFSMCQRSKISMSPTSIKCSLGTRFFCPSLSLNMGRDVHTATSLNVL